MTRRVVIVDDGQWGSVKREKGEYDAVVEYLSRTLKAVVNQEGERQAEVEVVKTTEGGLLWLGGTGGIMIFVTRGMLEKARRVAKEYRHIRVILFTGDIPEGEIIFLNKSSLPNREDLANLVLRS